MASNNSMKIPVAALLVAFILAGCRPHDPTPDEIRKQTAHATSQAARDAKAVVQGVVEGVKQGRTININRSSSDDLRSLPGIDAATARRIIDHRPYGEASDLVKRRVISREQYGRIADEISTH